MRDWWGEKKFFIYNWKGGFQGWFITVQICSHGGSRDFQFWPDLEAGPGKEGDISMGTSSPYVVADNI